MSYTRKGYYIVYKTRRWIVWCGKKRQALSIVNDRKKRSYCMILGEWSSPTGRTFQVAVKILKADALAQPGVFEDFIKEVQSMHVLNHPNLIR